MGIKTLKYMKVRKIEYGPSMFYKGFQQNEINRFLYEVNNNIWWKEIDYDSIDWADHLEVWKSEMPEMISKIRNYPDELIPFDQKYISKQELADFLQEALDKSEPNDDWVTFNWI